MSGPWREKQDVAIQDQTTEPFKFTLIQHLKEDITLTQAIAAGDTKANVSASHGFTAGDDFVVWASGYFQQSRVVSVNSNEITLEQPFDRPFAIATARVIRGTRAMNVNGSVTPVVFQFKTFNPYECVDIRIIAFCIASAGAPDDGKFGGIAALTNGLFLREVHTGGFFNMGNYRANDEFRDFGGEIEYTTKGPGGTNGTDILFDIAKQYGVALRISHTNDCSITATVRDDLTTLAAMHMTVRGHYTEGQK